MTLVVNDPDLARELKAERERTGADRYDEVWEGVYMMAALPNDNHQDLVGGFTAVLRAVIQASGLGLVRPGVNVSDRDEDWKDNYRCPDVVTFLNGTKAVNRDTHWVGGPDFLIEILSAQDPAREKFEFYAKVGVKEVLIVDRDPWALELYRPNAAADGMTLAGRVTVDDAKELQSKVVALSFKLQRGKDRPTIVITRRESSESWTI